MATDAFGRLRISDTYTLFEYYPSAATSLTNNDVDIWVNDVVSTASIGYNSGTNVVELDCNANGDIATRSTKLPMRYQPGKSRLFYFSAVPLSRVNGGSEDFTSRIGFFSVDGSKNPVQGHYFETDGTTLYWVCTYGGTENKIAQSNWNIDTFDGSGPSGKTLTISDMLNANLFVLDQEWLGVGRVRAGFNIEGVNYYANQFISNVPYPYTTTPRLPITYQMKATTISSSIKLGQVCCTAISEGGYTPIGSRISVGNGTDGANLASSGTKYILLGIKLQSGITTGILDVLSLDALYSGNTSNNAKIELQLHSSNGSIGATTGTITFTPESNSIIEVFRGATSGTNPSITTDGFILSSKYLLQKSDINLNSTEYSVQLTRSEVSQYDTLYVVAEVDSGTNQTIGATIDLIMSS